MQRGEFKCLERKRGKVMCGDLTGLKYRKGFMEKMYSLSDQDDPQDPSLLAFQVHPVEEISQF